MRSCLSCIYYMKIMANTCCYYFCINIMNLKDMGNFLY